MGPTLDRVLDVPEEGIRREGAILDRERFEVVAARLRAEEFPAVAGTPVRPELRLEVITAPTGQFGASDAGDTTGYGEHRSVVTLAPAAADAREVSLSTTLTNYGGEGAYLAIYVTDAAGARASSRSSCSLWRRRSSART